MGGKRDDIANKRFGKLLVICKIGYHNGHSQWKCICDCGKYKVASGWYLKNGITKHCGCEHGKNQAAAITIHGESNKTKEYIAWAAMKHRCYDKNCKGYKNYGGRGISVCDKWLNSYELFLYDMGRAPSPQHSLDRYPNVNGNYEPNNCRWATDQEQMNNTTRSKFIEYNGEKLTESQWARKINIYLQTFRFYVKKGYNIQEIINISKERKLKSPQLKK